ncbi:hypothetical protein PAT3040_05466 [Paenibacillus agaridevorans]|uniref:Uncharacterized protein n=1 Tax=Paenibacillus agaridevorans TaxID=171404 RepID=A0A2R5F2Y2_9BACL|nr:hypothetical protein PAT3040_05466 [Paenibacillus agaridevorans]
MPPEDESELEGAEDESDDDDEDEDEELSTGFVSCLGTDTGLEELFVLTIFFVVAGLLSGAGVAAGAAGALLSFTDSAA